MQRWEIKSHWVPVGLRKTQPFTTARVTTIDFDPTWDDTFEKAWAEAELLANDGWQLISVAPETCARMTIGENSGATLAGGMSYTAGYMLVFQRPKA
jgi:hypothetical protein